MNSTVSYHGTFPKLQLWCSKTPIGILFRMYYMNMNVLTLYIMYVHPLFSFEGHISWQLPPPPHTHTFKMAATPLLDIKRRTNNTIIHYIFITHTYFSFQICTYQICTHIIVFIYCVFAFFVHCLFVSLYIILYYLCLVLSLSFCCAVELLSM